MDNWQGICSIEPLKQQPPPSRFLDETSILRKWRSGQGNQGELRNSRILVWSERILFKHLKAFKNPFTPINYLLMTEGNRHLHNGETGRHLATMWSNSAASKVRPTWPNMLTSWQAAVITRVVFSPKCLTWIWSWREIRQETQRDSPHHDCPDSSKDSLLLIQLF